MTSLHSGCETRAFTSQLLASVVRASCVCLCSSIVSSKQNGHISLFKTFLSYHGAHNIHHVTYWPMADHCTDKEADIGLSAPHFTPHLPQQVDYTIDPLYLYCVYSYSYLYCTCKYVHLGFFVLFIDTSLERTLKFHCTLFTEPYYTCDK